jgi:hypothetical protein
MVPMNDRTDRIDAIEVFERFDRIELGFSGCPLPTETDGIEFEPPIPLPPRRLIIGVIGVLGCICSGTDFGSEPRG